MSFPKIIGAKTEKQTRHILTLEWARYEHFAARAKKPLIFFKINSR